MPPHYWIGAFSAAGLLLACSQQTKHPEGQIDYASLRATVSVGDSIVLK
jgi:hypothetical protein